MSEEKPKTNHLLSGDFNTLMEAPLGELLTEMRAFNAGSVTYALKDTQDRPVAAIVLVHGDDPESNQGVLDAIDAATEAEDPDEEQ